MIAYHYTTAQKFDLIKQSGLLLPSDIGVSAPELPILWFSTHPKYEPSALKPLGDEYGNVTRVLTVKELYEVGGGLVRFGISAAVLIRGEELRRTAKMFATVWRKLEKSGKKMKANPVDWLGYVGSMSLEDVSIEIMDDNMVWRPITH
ncbi:MULTISPECIES: hypothetical protein [unclassified Janthinobacterium]|uniref:hypothetical protein n=1 Tax=unclassified Janthinobacterium TaxID=2610881 RepID=UPI0018C95474|nr:hypothetical protein [Janthinobacterium sp. CG_23.4]MDH6155957.1 hypothetical protein [Janthinobacterium sp. CG_23.4]